MSRRRIKFVKLDSSFLYKLTGRFTLYLFLQVSVLFLLFVSGNFQSFADSSQRFLLLITSVLAIALTILSVSGFIESLVFLFLWKRKTLIVLMSLFLLSGAYSVVIIIFVRIISWLSGGM